VIHEDEKERLVKVEWGQTDLLYPVHIRLEAWDRVGLLRDISTMVAEDKVNIPGMNLVNHEDHTISLDFVLETRGLAQLSRLLAKIEGIRGVINVSRVGDESTTKTGLST